MSNPVVAPAPTIAAVISGELRVADDGHLGLVRRQLNGTDAYVVTYERCVSVALALAPASSVALVTDERLRTGVLAGMPGNLLQWYCLALALALWDLRGYDYILRWRTDVMGALPLKAVPSFFEAAYLRGQHVDAWLEGGDSSGVVAAVTDRVSLARAPAFYAAYSTIFEASCAAYRAHPQSGVQSGLGRAEEEGVPATPRRALARGAVNGGCGSTAAAAGSSWVAPDAVRRYAAQLGARPRCVGGNHIRCGCRFSGVAGCPWRTRAQAHEFASEAAHTFHLAARNLTCVSLRRPGVFVQLRPKRTREHWGWQKGPCYDYARALGGSAARADERGAERLADMAPGATAVRADGAKAGSGGEGTARAAAPPARGIGTLPRCAASHGAGNESDAASGPLPELLVLSGPVTRCENPVAAR